MSEINRRIVLAERPQGRPGPHNFRLEERPAPEPGAGEMLCRTIYLSLDPYMRGRMSDAPSYTPPVAIGEVMTGGTVGQVVRSNLDGFAPGDFVVGPGGWQDFAVFKAGEASKVDPAQAPISTALGVLGMPGMTAYTGLHEIGRPQAGETLVVAAASGAVGAVVGQIARVRGCRVVGVAGSRAKCDYVVNELGFDACLDHRAAGFAEALAAACPDGVDVYWENVGGAVFEAVLPLLNRFARIPVCGLIARYNATELPPGPDRTPLLFRNILSKRLTIRGFIVWDFKALEEEFRREVGQWLREGRLRYREDVREGLEQAPRAFMGLLEGENFGKLLIRVAPDPTA
ncbi:MAG TPA: NADP-dependent oxidoreductase [Geminicoccaceae bacterium]|nr:NADP-dependent oxidoreductase [Geminicoccaceae bacterium]